MSYAVADMKWGTPTFGTPSGTISWSSDLLAGLDYNAALYSLSEFNGALQAAFDAWENSASVDFQYTTAFNTADIRVDMAALAGSTVGRATTTFTVLPGTDRIVDGFIEMDSTVEWSPYGDASGGLSFYAVALHEIGHVIGLEHVSDTSEIMNPFVEANELGDGDVTGARVLYGADPGDVGGDPTPDESPTPAAADDGGGLTGAGGDGGDDGGGAAGLLLLGLLGALVAFLGPVGAAVGAAIGFGLGLSGGSGQSVDAVSELDETPDPAEDPQSPDETAVVADVVDDILTEFSDEVTLEDLIPILETEGIEIGTHAHVITDCDGTCGGACGHPDHLDHALTEVV